MVIQKLLRTDPRRKRHHLLNSQWRNRYPPADGGGQRPVNCAAAAALRLQGAAQPNAAAPLQVPPEGQADAQLHGPYPVRQPDLAVIARQAANDLLRLRDLRIGDEKDHELVFAPPIPHGTFQPWVPPVDAASAGLDGRAYLEFLVRDIRTEAGMGMILREDVLENANISDDWIRDIAHRMRPIMAQIYANPDLRIEMELLIT